MLNDVLQKAKIETEVRFDHIQYASLGAMLAFLTKKADATMLISLKSNLLIKAAKLVIDAIVWIEVLK